MRSYIILLIPLVAVSVINCHGVKSNNDSRNVVAFGEIAGKPTQSSIILKTRVSGSDTLINEDGTVPGINGYGRFEIGSGPDLSSSVKTEWLTAKASNGYTILQFIDDLKAGTTYYWRSIVGQDTSSGMTGEIHQFKTLPPPKSTSSLTFGVSSCMHYAKFMMGRNQDPAINNTVANTPASTKDRKLGYPAFKTLAGLDPDFHIFTGDNVYFDPRKGRAKTAAGMRKKYNQLFAFPRFEKFVGTRSTYWQKDDHDFRYNDSDTTNTSPIVDNGAVPSTELGINIFREQVPGANPEDPNSKTYGTYRVNKLLQIWIVESRDYRSPNDMEDGPGKSMWGPKQKAWLKGTLQESDAEFKLLITSCPLIGPDYLYKNDNPAAIGGFRHERDAFFGWLTDNGFRDRNFYIITGDRHWQYHSIHPSGYEEFGTGAFMIQNTATGPRPGDQKSSDPQGQINQPYYQVIGGFLLVHLNAEQHELTFSHYDEWGNLQNKVTKHSMSLSE